MSTDRDLIIRDKSIYTDLETVKTVEIPNGVDPVGHTHSKLVASDGAPDPTLSSDANGYLTAAVHSLVSAYNSAADNNVTGDGTTYQIICNTEIVDRNANYNNATGVFTAPATGYYMFKCALYLQGLTAATTGAFWKLVTNRPRNYALFYGNPYAFAYGGTGIMLNGGGIADLSIGETAYMDITVSNGALVVDVRETYTFFQVWQVI